MMTAGLIFACVFIQVFMLGLRSLAVNNGQRMFAMLNSSVIGCVNLVILRTVPHTVTPVEMVFYVVAGPCAIYCAMVFHKWLADRKRRQLATIPTAS